MEELVGIMEELVGIMEELVGMIIGGAGRHDGRVGVHNAGFVWACLSVPSTRAIYAPASPAARSMIWYNIMQYKVML